MLARLHLQMELKLFRQFRVKPAAAEQEKQASP
jgi:hypothetical protein